MLVGLSAAAVHGTKWIEPDRPAEVNRLDRHSPSGLVVRSDRLVPADLCVVDCMTLTMPERTAFDLGRKLRSDDARHLRRRPDACDRPGTPPTWWRSPTGSRVFAGYASYEVSCSAWTAARSPLKRPDFGWRWSTRGLPVPETQIEFRDRNGVVRVRVDMGWRQWKVAVEYDGVQHWSDRRQRSWDIDRIALLEASGWVVVRVSAEPLSRPDVVIRRVREKLKAAGCPM